ncbi:MAG: GFA family protein [Rhodovibrionaceae bacterium]
MELKGSCHCGAVRFTVQSHAPAPYMRCYCSICRKTAGGGGYAINLGADKETLEVTGEENLSLYRAKRENGERSSGERNFCKHCGSALWLWDPTWPELVHPHASAIDSELPEPPQRVHILLDSKAKWVPLQTERDDETFEGYPDRSLADWHKANGLGDL